ncbi:MAG: TetR family transcriptional regulator C-terminal domain-containing protein [Bauldia sp.]
MKKKQDAPPTPENRIRARNKAKILSAAVRIFAAKGFDGTSIAEIANLAGLPKANVYYYFKTKQAIYRTIIAGLILEWDKALAHLTEERHPADALADYIRAKLDFSRRHQLESKMFANEAVHGGRFLSRRDRAHMQAITVEKAKIFKAWAKAGKMDPVDPMHLFIMLWATTQFYADSDILAANALETRRLGARDFDKAAEVIIAVILKGCGIRSRGITRRS